jgi:trk system potassium uptake protein TrkA
MRIVVIGYGRVGSRTVGKLVERGHEISLIDKEGTRLSRASQLEGVALIQGNGIDVDVQREAGMGEADMLLAVTRDDNVNLMAAQVARSPFSRATCNSASLRAESCRGYSGRPEAYGCVPHVVCRSS